MTLGGDTRAVLLACGLIFLWALLLGVVKYRQIATSDSAQAHPYIDTAHRAALLYSFASLLLAAFVELSGWSEGVDAAAAFLVIAFFCAAIAGYQWHGLRRDTDNQFRDPVAGTHAFMWALIVAEIGGFGVLLAGFVEAQIL